MCQAELPACHRTAEVLRGEHHIRRCESSSLPAVIHTVNLIINQPPSPPTALPVQRHIRFYLTVFTHLTITIVTREEKHEKCRVLLITVGGFFFLFSFTFCEEGGEEGTARA